ncbi:MAG TPA: hypothetical protein VN371_00350 [Chlorobaculum sp.]|nr:hypothetical protein [Chlorobaculum sp.]
MRSQPARHDVQQQQQTLSDPDHSPLWIENSTDFDYERHQQGQGVHQKKGRFICKSISGARSIVQELGPEDEERLESIRYCPMQFQARVDGFDVRVHVIGRQTIATKIVPNSTV